MSAVAVPLGTLFDAPGTPFDALGTPFDAPGTPFDAPGTPFDAPGTHFDGLGTHFDGLGTPFDGPGKRRGGGDKGIGTKEFWADSFVARVSFANRESTNEHRAPNRGGFITASEAKTDAED